MLRDSSKASPGRTRPASALLTATLLAVLLATAAAVLIERARASQAATSEARRLEQTRMQAESLSAAALVMLDSGEVIALDGSALTLPAALGEGRVRLQEASGLVDLNTSPPERLAALFVALGVSVEEAPALADRIVDWRDPDNLRHLLGAEAPEYSAVGASPPENRPFTQEGELKQVLGFPPALFACVAPYVTVHSSWSYVDIGHSPPLIRRVFEFATHGGRSSSGSPIGQTVIVSAEAPLSKRAVYRLIRWVRMTGDPSRPFLVHRAQDELAPADQPTPSCGESTT